MALLQIVLTVRGSKINKFFERLKLKCDNKNGQTYTSVWMPNLKF